MPCQTRDQFYIRDIMQPVTNTSMSKSMHKSQDGFGYAFDRVREQYPYAYSEVFDAIELPIKYNSHNRYFVDQDALALMNIV